MQDSRSRTPLWLRLKQLPVQTTFRAMIMEPFNTPWLSDISLTIGLMLFLSFFYFIFFFFLIFFLRYFMRFFPSREYVVTERDTIKFELQNNRLSAPHIVTFLNGNPDFPVTFCLSIFFFFFFFFSHQLFGTKARFRKASASEYAVSIFSVPKFAHHRFASCCHFPNWSCYCMIDWILIFICLIYWFFILGFGW